MRRYRSFGSVSDDSWLRGSTNGYAGWRHGVLVLGVRDWAGRESVGCGGVGDMSHEEDGTGTAIMDEVEEGLVDGDSRAM